MVTTIDSASFLRHYEVYYVPMPLPSLGVAMDGVRHWVSLALLVMAWPAAAASISGTYVGTFSDTAILIQVVQTNDGNLTGRWELTALQRSGKLETINAPFTGASDGNTVVITLKPAAPLAGSLTLSGTADGSSLHLNAGGAMFNLMKTSDTAYRLQVAALENQSRTIIEEHNRKEAAERLAKFYADLLAKINGITPRVAAFSKDTPALIAKFPPINQRYKSMTEWMLAAHRRQLMIYGGGQASLARNQIDGSINQAAGQAYQFHMSVASSLQEVAGKFAELRRDLNEIFSACRSLGESPTNTGLVDSSNVRTACVTLSDSVKRFQPHADELDKAFADSERVWTEELRKQESIVKAADQASR
jgi:hypothetical protein